MLTSHEESVKQKFATLDIILNERDRRLWAASEAKAIGRGGVSIVARATKLSRTTIYCGLKELENPAKLKDMALSHKVRIPGGGRKSIKEYDPSILKELEMLVEPETRGDPESPLRWTCKSTRKLSLELQERGHKISRQKVADLLNELGYSLQSNRKVQEGSSHPDRDSQFKHIYNHVQAFQVDGEPVISVDTKKKELVGNYKNNGSEWRPKRNPKQVKVYDFIDKSLGKVNPYGVYDQTANEGWVSVGTDHDTAEFAVESIRKWWEKMGESRYPEATKLLITADGGGSNGHRVRLWKTELQSLANKTGLKIFVCHFPPGTSKWNKIEHRMFSHISMNWRGKPLTSHEVIVSLIGNTTTSEGLKIQTELDTNSYVKGKKITDNELKQVNLKRDDFHGDWNYIISPICSG